jgi:D-aminoacyl-tRNA deacylase
MRAVVQRVSAARVSVEGRTIGAIGPGLLVLLGISITDNEVIADWLLDKLLDLRIFENEAGKMDRSLRDFRGDLLVISQLTLLAATRKGRRPSFADAARPEQAIPLYERVVARARAQGLRVQTGEFGAHMEVALTNDGPVTIVLDSSDH